MDCISNFVIWRCITATEYYFTEKPWICQVASTESWEVDKMLILQDSLPMTHSIFSLTQFHKLYDSDLAELLTPPPDSILVLPQLIWKTLKIKMCNLHSLLKLNLHSWKPKQNHRHGSRKRGCCFKCHLRSSRELLENSVQGQLYTVEVILKRLIPSSLIPEAEFSMVTSNRETQWFLEELVKYCFTLSFPTEKECFRICKTSSHQ